MQKGCGELFLSMPFSCTGPMGAGATRKMLTHLQQIIFQFKSKPKLTTTTQAKLILNLSSRFTRFGFKLNKFSFSYIGKITEFLYMQHASKYYVYICVVEGRGNSLCSVTHNGAYAQNILPNEKYHYRSTEKGEHQIANNNNNEKLLHDVAQIST